MHRRTACSLTNIVIIGATESKFATTMPISAIPTVKKSALVGSPLLEALEKILRNGMRLSREMAWSNLGALKEKKDTSFSLTKIPKTFVELSFLRYLPS